MTIIHNILFDFGGVIFRLNSVEEPIRRFRSLGFADADQYLGIYGQRGLFLQVEDGSISEEEFLQQLAERCGRPSVSREEAAWAWMGYVRDVPPEGLAALLRLKKRYRLGLLSNTNPFIQSWARSAAFSGDGHPVGHYLHVLCCSHELHDYKPAPEMFLKALSAAGMRAEETLFLDDSQRNVDGAERVGIHGLLVPPDGQWISVLDDFLRRNGGGPIE